MIKKIVLISSLFLLFAVPSYGLEINAGGGLLMVSSYYNYGITLTLGTTTYKLKEFEDLMKTAGFTAKIDETGAAPAINIIAATKYSNMFSYYMRIMFVPDVSYHAVYGEPGFPLWKLDQKIDMPLMYFGGGFWAQFSPMQKLDLMLMGDIGYLLMDASIKQEMYDTSGTLLDSQSSRDNGSTYGFFIGAGAKYYFTGMFYGMADINYNSLGSSVYLGIGVGADFDYKPEHQKDEQASQPAGFEADPETEGDNLYKQQDYKGAFGMYKQALSLEKKAGLYVKMGNCYYAMGFKAQAISYYNYSLKLQDNPNVRAFVQKISKQ